MRLTSGVCTLLLAGLTAAPAFAQQVHIEAPPTPQREQATKLAPPSIQYEMTRPDDGSYYPPGPRVHHDPAFIEPLSSETETGRVGIAGWTAPNPPVGGTQAGYREVTGWFALGFAFEWGGPPAKRPIR